MFSKQKSFNCSQLRVEKILNIVNLVCQSLLQLCECVIRVLSLIIRYLRRKKKTTDTTTDSGYDTTAAGILMRKQLQHNSTIKTLVAMSRFKENLSKGEKESSLSDKRITNAPPREKVGTKQNMKEVPKTDEKTLRYTNFSNLVDRRARIKKEKAQIVTMKMLRAIQILPRKSSCKTKEGSRS